MFKKQNIFLKKKEIKNGIFGVNMVMTMVFKDQTKKTWMKM
jgi:hypothetical protein